MKCSIETVYRDRDAASQRVSRPASQGSLIGGCLGLEDFQIAETALTVPTTNIDEIRTQVMTSDQFLLTAWSVSMQTEMPSRKDAVVARAMSRLSKRLQAF